MPDDLNLPAMAAETYAATADHFDDPALSFWDRVGRATVARAGLRPGEQVLDACCGTGASALPAALQVGPEGSVLGLDLSEPALARARAKAAARGLGNVRFRMADVRESGLADDSFDAVVCVFGLFFLPDMVAGLRELWRLVRPGGRLAIAVWGPGFMEPLTGAFWSAVAAERPDLVHGFEPWTRLSDPEILASVLGTAGIPATPRPEAGDHPVVRPDDWWKIVLGTGLRATVEALGPDAAERVRAANRRWIHQHGVTSVQANVIYAVAHRRPGTAVLS